MKIHTEGCLDIFSEQIGSNIGGVGGVGIGIGLIQVLKHWMMIHDYHDLFIMIYDYHTLINKIFRDRVQKMHVY